MTFLRREIGTTASAPVCMCVYIYMYVVLLCDLFEA
jgi:hypothetical protein